jgi:Arm DNA-binding domain
MALEGQFRDSLAPNIDAEVILWDQEVRGFGIRARSGGVKTYILQYRAGTGRGAPLRKLTIGKHGSPWTPDMARTEAKRLLELIAAGEDPAERRAAERKALTVSELCDLYVAEGATHKKPSTLKTDRGRIANHIKPRESALPVLNRYGFIVASVMQIIGCKLVPRRRPVRLRQVFFAGPCMERARQTSVGVYGDEAPAR